MIRSWIATLLIALAATPAGAVSLELISRIPPRRASDTANGTSDATSLSAGGRFLAFTSDAVNLIPGVIDDNDLPDVFLFDRGTGTITLVSRNAASPRTTGNNQSENPVVSADGRFVAFLSQATDLVPGQEDVPSTTDIFLFDRVNGTTELVSHTHRSDRRAANGASLQPAVSADGSFVAFTSYASNLAGVLDPNGTADVFLFARRSGEVTPVSHSGPQARRMANGLSSFPGISANGRFVVFQSSASNVAFGQNERNGGEDVFLWDRTTDTSIVVSHAAANPRATGNQSSGVGLVSADGAFVVYQSFATNLVPGQVDNGAAAVFLFERPTGRTTLVSRSLSSPLTPANNGSFPSGISADGRFVLFESSGNDLVPGQAPPGSRATVNVFLWSRATGQVTLVSRAAGSVHSDGSSFSSRLSADGSWVAFESDATDLVAGFTDGNAEGTDVYLWERRSERTTLLSESAASPGMSGNQTSFFPLLSADGRWIAYTSFATDLDPGVRDHNNGVDVVLAARTGEREIVTLHPPGLASATPQGASSAASIDASGRFVAFVSTAPDLIPRLAKKNLGSDVFLYDRTNRSVTLVSHSTVGPTTTGNLDSFTPRISADGRWVVFGSRATDLVSRPFDFGSTDGNVFLWNRETGAITLVSHAAGSASSANRFSNNGVVSADGALVAFTSLATDLVPGQADANGGPDVFLWERATGAVSLVSRAAGSPATAGDRDSEVPSISADGRFVAFHSRASNLSAEAADGNGIADVYVFDRIAGTSRLVSGTAASPAAAAGGRSAKISADGSSVFFRSLGTNLVPDQVDRRSTEDLFLHDRTTGTTRLVSHAAGSSATAVGGGGEVDLSADGRFVVFGSLAANLVPGQIDENHTLDVFLFDRETLGIRLISHAAGSDVTAGQGASVQPVISSDGRFVAFASFALDLAAGVTGPFGYNIYVHDRAAGTTILVSHSKNGALQKGNRDSFTPLLAANGSALAFTSSASDLVPRDFNRQNGALQDAFAASVP